MKETINSYFAILIITIAGVGAAMLIIRTANKDMPLFVSTGNNEASYSALQKSILTN